MERHSTQVASQTITVSWSYAQFLDSVLDYRYKCSNMHVTNKGDVIQRKSEYIIQYWLVGWVLWHINLCRLFNINSIFMQIVLIQKKFSLAWVHSLIVKNICISSYSVKSNSSNSANSV